MLSGSYLPLKTVLHLQHTAAETLGTQIQPFVGTLSEKNTAVCGPKGRSDGVFNVRMSPPCSAQCWNASKSLQSYSETDEARLVTTHTTLLHGLQCMKLIHARNKYI
jgi:hypothetical protein